MVSRIYIDNAGVTCFDRYFEYLRSVEKWLPRELAAFALDPRRYELNGPLTLHDAHLRRFAVIKAVNSSGEVETKVELELLLAATDAALKLTYSGTERVESELNSNLWPNRPVDLLVHEFDVLPDERFTHTLTFDRGVRVQVIFQMLHVEQR